MEEASIFVHVAVSDISGKVSAACRTTGLAPAPVPPQPCCQGRWASWLLTGPVSTPAEWAVGAPDLCVPRPLWPPSLLPVFPEPPHAFCVSGSPVLRPSLAGRGPPGFAPRPRVPGWGSSSIPPALSSGPRQGQRVAVCRACMGGPCGPGADCLSPATSTAPRCCRARRRRPLAPARHQAVCLSCLPVSTGSGPAVGVSRPSLCLFGLAVRFPMSKVYF